MQPLFDFFGSKDFIPHGYCLSWRPALLWLHVISDLLIALAYYSIPLMLFYFVRERKDLPYPWMVLLFAGFIVACGTTHLLSAITIWIPLYWVDGLIKAFTAIISIASAALMLWVIPRLLYLPSTKQLKAEIQQRKLTEDKLGLFHSLFELTSDCVFMISPKQDFRFVFVNDATCRHFGRERSQLLKSGMSDLNTDVKNQTDIDAICQEIKTKKGLLLKTVHRVASDREIPVEVSFNYLSYQGDEYIAGYFHDITERIKAEENANATSQYTRNLIEASLDPLVTISSAGKIMDVNQATIDVTGVGRDQLIDSDFSNYFTEPDQARAGYHQVFSQGYVTDYPLAIRHASGKITEVLYNASVYRNAQGEVAGVFAAARDVTERKRAEEKLQASAHYAASLIEASLDPLLTINTEGQIITVNEATEQITGVARDQLIGSDFTRYFTEPDKVRSVHQDVFTKGFIVEYPLAIRHVSGDIFHVLFNASPYRNKNGEIQGMLAVARNIMEQKRAQETQLIHGHIATIFATIPHDEMFNEVLKVVLSLMQSPFGVFGYLDEAGDLLVPTMTRQVWDKRQVPEKSIIFLRESWGDSSWPTAIREKRVVYSNDSSANIPEGHVDIQRHISLPILFQGEAIGLFQVANKETDYTEADINTLDTIAKQVSPLLNARLLNERAKETIRKLNDELEIRVLERTAELEGANADLESFSYSVSHDLRAPLRAIDGFATILREDYAAQLDTEGQRLFQVVSDNAKKMGQLIEDILFLSRTSRHEMQINRIDLKALALEVWDGLAADRTGRAIEFRLTDLPMAYADNSALRQVLQNLLGNAIKFTRGRKPAIIEMGGTVEGKENIYFICDNGVGFDMIYVNKLFGLFQRLHSVTEFEGTGVGLAIVKRFIIKHGGRVWAEGKPGEGATFWFTLPIQQHVEPKHE